MVYASDEPRSIPTLADALQGQTVDYLKKLAVLVSDEKNKPIRKADLIEFILRRVNGERGRLRQVEDDVHRIDDPRRGVRLVVGQLHGPRLELRGQVPQLLGDQLVGGALAHIEDVPLHRRALRPWVRLVRRRHSIRNARPGDGDIIRIQPESVDLAARMNEIAHAMRDSGHPEGSPFRCGPESRLRSSR